MQKLICILLCALLANASLYAQTNPKSGYVITNENDTIAGTIDYLSDNRNCKECHFIPHGSDMMTIYKPLDIQGFRFADNGAYYVRKLLTFNSESKNVFAELLVKGGVSLYYYSETDEDYYFFEGEDGNLYGIKDDHLAISDTKEDYAEKVRNRRKSMEGVPTVFKRDMATCQELWMMEFSPQKAASLVKRYDDRFCQSSGDCVVYQSDEKKRRMLDAYLWASVSRSSMNIKVNGDPAKYHTQQTWVSVGGDFSLPQYSKSLFMRVGVSVGRWDFPESWAYKRQKGHERIKVTSIETVMGAGYRFWPEKVVCPYVVGGICLLGRQLYPDIKKIYRNSDGRNEATVWKEEETDKSWGCTGYKIGAGVDLWKIVCLEVNFRKASSSIVEENGLCLSAGLKLYL